MGGEVKYIGGNDGMMSKFHQGGHGIHLKRGTRTISKSMHKPLHPYALAALFVRAPSTVHVFAQSLERHCKAPIVVRKKVRNTTRN